MQKKTRLLEKHFTEFMLENGLLDPLWTLDVITTLLDNQLWQENSYWHFGIDDLIRLILRIYTSPTATEDIQIKAMDLFDRLMSQFTGETYKVLAEWER